MLIRPTMPKKSARKNVRTGEALLQARLARAFKLRPSDALRLIYFVRRLYKFNLVHGESAMVPYRADHATAVVGTVDWQAKCIGCAMCGEHAADSGEPLADGFRLVILRADLVPYEIESLSIVPGLLYCAQCWTKHESYLRVALKVD